MRGRTGFASPLARLLAVAAAVGALTLAAGCDGGGVPVGAGDGDDSPPAAWAAVAAGDGFSCAAAADGRPFCWGSRRGGRLGDGATRGVSDRPVRVGASLRLDTVAAGFAHACGLTSDGEAHCWGRNGEGQLGAVTSGRCRVEGETVSCASRPVRSAAPLRFRSVSAGGRHTCGVTTEGILFCWGSNATGQLGTGGFGSGGAEPRAILRGASVAAAGELHTCALALGADVLCWGANGDGQLGDRTFFPRTTPTAVTIRGGTALTAGARHTCVLAPAHCWGRGTEGQIGDGEARTVPFPVRVVTDRSFTLLKGGARHTCGVAEDGEALCWGSGAAGALGIGDTPDLRSVPTPVAGDRSWDRLAAGGGHTCGIDERGDLWCWGRNAVGQLGDGSREDRTVPTSVEEPAG